MMKNKQDFLQVSRAEIPPIAGLRHAECCRNCEHRLSLSSVNIICGAGIPENWVVTTDALKATRRVLDSNVCDNFVMNEKEINDEIAN